MSTNLKRGRTNSCGNVTNRTTQSFSGTPEETKERIFCRIFIEACDRYLAKADPGYKYRQDHFNKKTTP